MFVYRATRLTTHRRHVVRSIGAAAALLGALPSLIWAASDPDLLTDDFAHLDRLRRLGPWDAMWSWSFEHPARPLLGPYHAFTYGLIGDRPVVQALLMAALNAGVVACLWGFGRRWVGDQAALAASVLYAVIPNRASTRLWFPTGNYLLAVIIVLVGLHLLADRRRRGAAAATFAAAVMLFEGALGLAVAGAAVWTLGALRRRLRTGVYVVLPSVIAAAWMYSMSPKRGAPNQGWSAVESLSSTGHGLIASGLWGPGAPGTIGAALLLVLAVPAFVGRLPSFAALRQRTQVMRIGLVVTGLAAAPFVVGGSLFAARGIFDRTNAVPMVGVTVFIAGAAHLHRCSMRLAVPLLAFLTPYLLSLNAADIEDYVRAADSGRLIAARATADIPLFVDHVIVWPRPLASSRSGVAAYVYPADLDAALRVRNEPGGPTTLLPWSREHCRRLAAEVDAVGYDWARRKLVADAAQLCKR